MRSYTYFIADEFVKREFNSFELNADNVIAEITAENFGAVIEKALRVYGGNAECEADGVKTRLEEVHEGTKTIKVFGAPFVKRDKYTFGDLVEIIRRLRDPDGCPWDRAQTHESIRINCLEEAYELVDAVDLDDPDKMCEEVGDVLMQAAFHTLIEEERGHFTMTDVISGTCEKLITRHTHVFGQDKASEADGALTVWEKNKMKEKHQETFSDAVNDVPECFPALLRAQKIAKRVVRAFETHKPFGYHGRSVAVR